MTIKIIKIFSIESNFLNLLASREIQKKILFSSIYIILFLLVSTFLFYLVDKDGIEYLYNQQVGLGSYWELNSDTGAINLNSGIAIKFTTGSYENGLSGSDLSIAAFNSGLSGTGWIVTAGLVFFAFTTVLGWSFYGERGTEYLFGV